MVNFLLPLTLSPYCYIFAVLVSLAIGSFLNVVILRYPTMLNAEWQAEAKSFLDDTEYVPPAHDFNLSKPDSHCPQCKNPLKWWHNIPLLSFIVLRGRCAKCKQPISWRYPIIEVLTLLCTLAVVISLGFTLYSLMVVILTWVMIAQAGIDAEHQFIPDNLSYSMLWLGLLVSATGIGPISTALSIYGAALGYLALWLIAKAFYLLRKKQGMGHGDFKLLAMLGAWTGPTMLPFILIIACVLSLAMSAAWLLCKKMKTDTPIPFGPSLCIGGWLCLLFGTTIIPALYLNM